MLGRHQLEGLLVELGVLQPGEDLIKTMPQVKHRNHFVVAFCLCTYVVLGYLTTWLIAASSTLLSLHKQESLPIDTQVNT